MSYGAVQRRGTSDHVISRLTKRDAADLDPPLLAALRLGTYELLFSEHQAPHAVVNESVELSKGAGRGSAALANAVLRRVARERRPLLEGLTDHSPEAAAVKHSHPEWLARLWWDELGPASARGLLAADNAAAETALRVNVARTRRAQVVERLRDGGVRTAKLGSGLLAPRDVIVIDGPTGDVGVELIEAGLLVPQSRASAAVVALLDPQPGERVLDLCAGPGIKTSQIAARLAVARGARDSEEFWAGSAGGDLRAGGEEGLEPGEVVGVEIDPRRAAEARGVCERLGATNVRIEVADAGEAELGSGYDRVLVDPPCSGLGTLAQRPDARWRRAAGDPARLGELQRRILKRGMAALAPGGVLAYATCTISRRESEDVVVAELETADGGEFDAVDLGMAHPELASPHDRRFLQTRPDRDRTAGFFIALLRRRPDAA
jgi:16S rRNA (cytosine967-C5)-methyltransferase